MKTAGIKILQLATLTISLFFTSALFAQVNAASLSFSPASGSYDVGDAVQLKVILNTGGVKIESVDAALEFDDTKLTYVSIAETSTFDPNYLTKMESSGTILISAVSQAGVTGASLEVATINFTAKAAGTAAVDYITEGALASSVPASLTFEELLTSATSGSYTIGASTTDADEDETPIDDPVTQPSTGVFDSMNIGIIISVCLFVTGGLTSLFARKAYKE